MRFSVTNPIAQARADTRAYARQARFGMVVALTRTVQDGKRAEDAEIARAVDRPTPYTGNAVYVQPATMQRAEAAFGLKDNYEVRAPGTPPVNYLGPNIEGGARRMKAMERILQKAGHLPTGWHAVPGQAARLDAYGNVSRGQVTQVLSQLRLQLTAGYERSIPQRQRPGKDGTLTKEQKRINAARRRAFVRAGGQFFVVKPGSKRGVQPGIYQRQVLGKKVHGPARRFPKAVFIFVGRATYRRRIDWERVAERTVAERLDYHAAVALQEALATARP